MNPRSVAALVFAVSALVMVRAETADEVIARARAYLGGEQQLNAVTSIRYSGMLEGVERVPSPDDKTKTIDRPARVPTEIIFQKPYHQKITLTRTPTIDTTALDGYDGWNKRYDPSKPEQWSMTLLDENQIKTLRANTWENLNFFKGIEKKGGTVQLGEESSVDGVTCVKLIFSHDARNVFQRYFDKATGRLVKTVTADGTEIREQGEMLVNGIRFPRKIVQTGKNGQQTIITFDKIELNQNVPDSEFAVPSLQVSK